MGRNWIVQKTNNSYLSISSCCIIWRKPFPPKNVVSLNLYIFLCEHSANTRAHSKCICGKPPSYRIVAQMCGDKFSILFFLHLSSVERFWHELGALLGVWRITRVGRQNSRCVNKVSLATGGCFVLFVINGRRYSPDHLPIILSPARNPTQDQSSVFHFQTPRSRCRPLLVRGLCECFC